MTDSERAKALADDLSFWCRDDVDPADSDLIISALHAHAAKSGAPQDLREAASAFFDENPAVMDLMQSLAFGLEETGDVYEDIRRKREAWRNVFLSAIDPLTIVILRDRANVPQDRGDPWP